MNRRVFFNYLAAAAAGIAGIMLMDESLIRKVWYRLEGMFKPSVKLPADGERGEAALPSDGKAVSVEKALNSRCNSDNDDNPMNFHWGMFDGGKKLSEEQVKGIIGQARIPRFTDGRVEIRHETNVLSFVIDNRTSGSKRDWMMVESGMQQQAICLVCAAGGIGMVFSGQGKDGTGLSEEDLMTLKALVDPMKPSYERAFWSSATPMGTKGWQTGNLPDPVRDGGKALLACLSEVRTAAESGKKATWESVSQLLWAARGRTPHYYKSTPWGMTIPVWTGKQDTCSVYLISRGKLFEYVNWDRGRPTHALQELGEINDMRLGERTGVVLGKNEETGKALWEVGYQLLNMLVQAHSLGISYESKLLDETSRKGFDHPSLKNPVAILML